MILALTCTVPLPQAGSLRDIDWKNFSYPWNGGNPPNRYQQWIVPIPLTKVALSDGVSRFGVDLEDSEVHDDTPGLWLQSVTYGKLDGDEKEIAAVDLRFSIGGTANWHYLYVYRLNGGVPEVLGVLESGSRAYGGLIQVAIEQSQLVLDFADPEKRVGDCCSKGYIRVHYEWKDGRFVEAGKRERGDLK
jgi:hypothetical protein